MAFALELLLSPFDFFFFFFFFFFASGGGGPAGGATGIGRSCSDQNRGEQVTSPALVKTKKMMSDVALTSVPHVV
jgi:hypothetical protein